MLPKRSASLVLAIALLPLTSAAGIFSRGYEQFKQPTPDELSMTGVPFAPGAPAVILDWIARHDDEESTSFEYLRIKILTAEGKKYGDVELPYVPGFSSLHGIDARVIKPNGTIVPFDGKMLDKLVIKAGGLKLMQKTFALPDVQPGSIVEYHYTRTWPVSELMTNHWALQREIPIVHTNIWVRPFSRGISNFFTFKGVPEPRRIGDHIEIELANTPPFEAEPFAPPERAILPFVEFFYARPGVNIDQYWTEIGKSWADSIEGFIGNRSGIRNAAQEITAGATTSDAKLRRIYERVQKVRNLSFEEIKSDQEMKNDKIRDNKNIENVLRDNYGYRNEINRLFVGLARGAGFTANIVAASQRDESFFSKAIPDARQLPGEVAVVSADGKDRYFDPGTPHNPYGLLPWEITAVPALRLDKKGSTWVQTPEPVVNESLVRRKSALILGDETLKGTLQVMFVGQAALRHRLKTHNDDDASGRKKIEDEVKGWLPDGSTVKLTSLSGLSASDDSLTADFDVEIANLISSAGSRTILPLAIFAGADKNPFTATARKYSLYFHYPYQIEDDVTLSLPAGVRIDSAPQPTKIDLGGVAYMSSFKTDENRLTFTRSMKVEAVLIESKQYPTVRSFFNRVATADQQTVVLRKAQ